MALLYRICWILFFSFFVISMCYFYYFSLIKSWQVSMYVYIWHCAFFVFLQQINIKILLWMSNEFYVSLIIKAPPLHVHNWPIFWFVNLLMLKFFLYIHLKLFYCFQSCKANPIQLQHRTICCEACSVQVRHRTNLSINSYGRDYCPYKVQQPRVTRGSQT